MSRILLTGATGLLGAHILQQGQRLGYEFRALARNLAPRSYLAQLQEQNATQGIEYRSVDLMNPASWGTLFQGIDTVIHSAAHASPFEKDRPLMQQLHVDSSVALYQAARFAGVKNWVQISSVATLCRGDSDLMVSEQNIGEHRPTPYAQTKYAFDQWLDQQNDDIRKLTIHPCYMLGDWDARPSSGSIFFALKMKRLKVVVNSQKNFVHAADVAQGLFQALTKNAHGHYVLGHHNLSIKDFLGLCLTELKQPEQMANIQFLTREEFAQLQLPDEQLTLAREFSLAAPVNYSKAIQDFGYAPQSHLTQTIQDTLDYFERFRMLRR